MPDILRIKRRPVGGAAGPPSSLTASEIAFNEQDNTLYYGAGNSGGLATSIIPIGGPGAFPPLTIADTPPASPVTGALWFDSVNAQLYLRYSDLNSSQWVIANNIAAGGGLIDAPNDGGFYGRQSAVWTLGVASFNTRRGAVTLTSGDVTSALTYTPVNRAGDTMSGGLGFGSAVSGSPTDLTRHITLWGSGAAGTSYGLSVTGSSLNVVCGSGAAINFYSGASSIATLSSIGKLTLVQTSGSDPINMSVPNGNYCRLLATVQGVRTWSYGVGNTGAFVISDESGGFYGRLSIGTDGGVNVTGPGISYSAVGDPKFAFQFYTPYKQVQLYLDGSYGGGMVLSYATANNVTMIALDSGPPQMFGYYAPGVNAFGWSFYYSDRSLKRDIKPTTLDALDIINRLPVYECELQPPIDGSPEQHWDCALIADEVLELLPRAVVKETITQDGAKIHARVEAYPLVCAMVRAMQQLTDRVAALERLVT